MDQDIAGRASRVSVDRCLARSAAAHHGVFSRSEAVAAGATKGLMDHRVATGKWEVLYPGVYRIAGAPPSWRQRLLVTCLVAGEGAVASHRASAALRRLPGGSEEPLELSAPKARRVRRPGITVHQASTLEPVDLTIVDAIPVTTAARTLIDLAAVVSADVVEEALDDALRRRLTSLSRLAWRIADLGGRGRPGVGVLRELVEARSLNGATSESVIETRFLRLLRRARMPAPVSQHEVRDRGRLLARVDFAYPEVRIAIEVDGYRWHSGRARWERDLGRGNELTARGWRSST